jgi:hypothetical protein
LSQAHALVGQIAIVLAVIAAIWSVVLAITRRPVGSLFLGNAVWVGLAVVLAAVLGAATAVLVAPPGDALHVVYGILAVALLPGATLIASSRPADDRAVVAVAASIVLVILLFRLLQTGA